MAVDVKNLIAAINPSLYCEKELRSKVKRIVRNEGYLAAAKVAKLRKGEFLDVYKAQFEKGPFELVGVKNPIEQHNLVYDLAGSPNQILEELYFWILDYVNGVYGKTDKLIDNFVTSPGSSLFTENLQKRATAEQNASRMLGNVNEVVKSVVQLMWSVKEYDTLLIMYDNYHSRDEDEKEAALLSLKQRWLDKVDIQKGGSAIKQLAVTGAQQPGFVLLVDAFMAAKSAKDVKKIDLNDRLRRLVRQRAEEFFVWLKESEKGLRQRYLVEKNYLKTQMNNLKLYAHWVKPYLKAAQKLRENAEETSGLVTAFNTALFELVLFGEGNYDPQSDVDKGELPVLFSKKKFRKYSPFILVEMKFRSTPEAVGQHARFRGRIEIIFTSFSLNEDEHKVLKKELEKDDLGDLIGVVEGITSESLERIQADVDGVLKEIDRSENRGGDDANPFVALFSFAGRGRGKTEKKEERDLSNGIPLDGTYEEVIRNQAILKARVECLKLYGNLKKAYSLPAF